MMEYGGKSLLEMRLLRRKVTMYFARNYHRS